jgi:protein-S-isoprenylcysteine O-methyltransferase Ste14
MLVRLTVRTLLSFALIGAVLFLAAEDWGWRQAWAFLGESGALSLAIGLGLAKTDPELLRARMTSPFGGGQRPKDLAVIVAMSLGFVAWLALMGLDAQRFMWTTVPLGAQILGAVLIGLGMWLVWGTFRANPYATPQVKVQEDRGQRVISDGPYRYIRHPMYAGALLYVLGAPLVLGSLWGLLGGALLTVGMGVRAVFEEEVLKTGLPGYDAYMKQVPWRIVPGVW